MNSAEIIARLKQGQEECHKAQEQLDKEQADLDRRTLILRTVDAMYNAQLIAFEADPADYFPGLFLDRVLVLPLERSEAEVAPCTAVAPSAAVPELATARPVGPVGRPAAAEVAVVAGTETFRCESASSNGTLLRRLSLSELPDNLLPVYALLRARGTMLQKDIATNLNRPAVKIRSALRKHRDFFVERRVPVSSPSAEGTVVLGARPSWELTVAAWAIPEEVPDAKKGWRPATARLDAKKAKPPKPAKVDYAHGLLVLLGAINSSPTGVVRREKLREVSGLTEYAVTTILGGHPTLFERVDPTNRLSGWRLTEKGKARLAAEQDKARLAAEKAKTPKQIPKPAK